MLSIVSEMWAWYAVTVVVIGARILSRRLLFKSLKRLQADDWLMVFVLLAYTSLLIVIHIQTYTPTNLINPAENITLTPKEIERRVYGSKLVLVTEQLQMVTIWSVKGCLLIMYSRMTMSLKYNLLVKIVAGYVLAGFVIMEILWFIWCRPFHWYWKVPAPNLNCSAETNHMITNAVINISSDIMIICLPMPILIQSQLPLKRKLILCGVFMLGSFTILAAILSKYYSLGSPYGSEWIYWYIREVSTAIITANLPLIWTLLQRIFGLGNFSSIYGRSSRQRTGEVMGQGRYRSAYGNITSATTEAKATKKHDPYGVDISPSESQEGINSENGIQLKIWQQHDVHIVSEELVSRNESHSFEGSDKKDIERPPFNR